MSKEENFFEQINKDADSVREQSRELALNMAKAYESGVRIDLRTDLDKSKGLING